MPLAPALAAAIAQAIRAATGEVFAFASLQPVGGGCINQNLAATGQDGRRFFIKLNDADKAEMFAAEAAGLEALGATGAIRVPRALAHGTGPGQAWLVLEWLPLGGHGDAARLGRQLAALHLTQGEVFGWWRDNTIGATPQVNTPNRDWIAFYREERLGRQLRMAARNGARRALLDAGERLMAELPAFFPGHAPPPSLLHGDLWGGNHGFADGEPVLFDPAVYHGDREADLAMTELFGGFPETFYAAYREAWPLDAGYRTRRTLYNLYHVLNHFNLFGGGYGAQAGRMLGQLLAEIR
ncbi:MAG: fructosamine kinase family protein [Pseudomonadota bacterium]